MNTVDTIELLLNLPVKFRHGDKSPRTLITESGVNLEKLTSESIAAALKAKPELVKEWLYWSEDKRSAPGYYFVSEGDQFIVGLLPDDERVEFDDPIAACADFVIKEANAIY